MTALGPDIAAIVPAATSDPESWDAPLRRLPNATSPVLVVDGFEGPLDWLLQLARTRKLDLARLSILALVKAFVEAMAVGLTRAPGAPAPDLGRWGDWLVMATQLAELRSRLVLPADAPEARSALARVEALRLQGIHRLQMQAAADWLERQPQLGRDVFARGSTAARSAARGGGRIGTREEDDTEDSRTDASAIATGTTDVAPTDGEDLTDLLRACLVALRLPSQRERYQPRQLPFWSFRDAAARITRLLPALPAGASLGEFLPEVAERGAEPVVHCRASVAAVLVASLELARDGAVTLDQDVSWDPIQVASAGCAVTRERSA
ncbi:segregation and condensation protein A [Lichenicoccus sp.]|uniref:segregation and condensation protein A n=1 Tax=Lichenicoccus sp. TaxID=2781899 RepID=UPI003D0D792C